MSHQSSDSERTQSEDRGGDFMDTAVDSDNLLLLASLLSYVSTAVDDISITGNVVGSSMVHKEIAEVSENRDVVDPLLAPSVAIDTSAIEREADAPLLVIEEVAGVGATRGGVTDPLLPPEGVACDGVAGEGIISEPTMPTFNLDPPKSKKITRTASVAHTSIMSKDFH